MWQSSISLPCIFCIILSSLLNSQRLVLLWRSHSFRSTFHLLRLPDDIQIKCTFFSISAILCYSSWQKKPLFQPSVTAIKGVCSSAEDGLQYPRHLCRHVASTHILRGSLSSTERAASWGNLYSSKALQWFLDAESSMLREHEVNLANLK